LKESGDIPDINSNWGGCPEGFTGGITRDGAKVGFGKRRYF